MMTPHHIQQSNLIEGVDDIDEDIRSLEAWAFIIHQKKLTHANIMALHRMIMLKQLSDNEAGHMRKVPVMVGGRLCPSPYLAEQMLNNWILDMANWRALGTKAMHIRFEHIHPFVDGNGRTGRMLMWWHERMLGLEPTLIKYSKREDYYKWFEIKHLKPIPKFANEDEEREFWMTHDSTEYVDWDKAERIEFPNLKLTKHE